MEKDQDYRVESDLLGELQVPTNAYYGVQTQRAINNYKISTGKMSDYPDFVVSIAYVKKAAAKANAEADFLDAHIAEAICKACDDIIEGKLQDQFPVDMVQGGAGTSVNMNANEVIANRALEIMGYKKGDYAHCYPNDHVNCGQSTNDAYPTALRYAVYRMNKTLVESLRHLVDTFNSKADEYKDAVKMGRTQLQDAVPMTSGQEFKAFAHSLEQEIDFLNENAKRLLTINMGATAIGTGKMSDYPDFVVSIAYVKKAAAKANAEADFLDAHIAEAICKACDDIIEGKLQDQFPVDMVQGGAGTSVNMNANEVIANRALEIMGYKKGDYAHCYPNDHVNCGQSTNDAYPTALRYAVYRMNKTLVESLRHLVDTFNSKADEYKDAVKMGRTQLQDAVPMTSGQEFKAFAHSLEQEIDFLNENAKRLLTINMGATAIGTGINAAPGYDKLVTKYLAEYTKEDFKEAGDMIAATPDTADYVSYSGAMKRLAVKLSKICNDLRLMASGPRCGLHEINLPPMAPGSSIMPGKVNPVIPEVTNQVCFKVIGNDTTITIAAEAGQLQLNVMEPIIVQCLFESSQWLNNAMNTLADKCVKGITINTQHNLDVVNHSIGIVTALNPYIGYKNSTKVAKEALETGKSLHEIVVEKGFLSKEEVDKILDPKSMITTHNKMKI